MFRCRYPLSALFSLLCVLALTGCTIPPNGPLGAVEPISSKPRVGNVYLLRGWIGVFSTGIDALTDQINAAGVRAVVYQDTQWPELSRAIIEKYSATPTHEPLILVGHSYGADDVVRIARRLEVAHIPVDLLITLDPVTPPRVPPNVRICYNLYQSNGMMDAFPFLRGIPLEKESDAVHTQLTNGDIRADRTDLLAPGLDHFNIEKQPKIHDDIVKHILAACPPRQTYLAAHNFRAAANVPAPAPAPGPAPRPQLTQQPAPLPPRQ